MLCLPCLLVSMDASVLNLAVGPISEDLRPSGSQLLWIVDVYGFMLVGSLITMGTLGDRIGRRRLLLTGAAAFGGASVLAACSVSAGMLIAARALLGIAGATLMPSTLALIGGMFTDPGQRTTAVGIWMAALSAGGALGSPAGGLMLALFPWQSVFLLAVPPMALLLVAGPLLLPESRAADAGRPDLASAALSLAAVLAVVYGLKRGAQDGLGGVPLLGVAAGLGAGVLFVRRQRRPAAGHVELGLFRARAFSTALAVNLLGFMVTFGAFFFTGQYLQLVLGLGSLEAGLWMAPSFLGFAAGSVLAPALVRRVGGTSIAMAGGLGLATAGFAAVAHVDPASGLTELVAGSVVFSLGLGPVFTLCADIAVGAASPGRAGAASALSETSTELGTALGIAILGTLGTAVYRARMTGAVPSGVPPEAAESARDTLGGAVAASDRLPVQAGADLLDAARQAFTAALQTTAAVSAAVTAACAVAILVLLRPSGADELC